MLELYNDGIDKINNKEYQEAQEILSELGDYKDSFNQINLAKILQQQKEICDKAIEEFNSGNYENAIKLFEQIEHFKASEEYIKNYNKFVQLFEQIDGFKDSNEYIEKANTLLSEKDNNDSIYNEAYDHYKSNDYISAIQEFSKIK